jgi:sortase B
VVIAVSVFKIGSFVLDDMDAAGSYSDVQEMFFNGDSDEEAAYSEYFQGCDFDALQAVNEEIIAWITIPDTVISYPVCQTDDNEYYLYHLYDGTESKAGSIFMDYRCQSDFSSFNTILFGHRMLNKTMFAYLKNYLQESVWEEHPYIYLATPSNIYVYTIYSAFQGDPYGLSYKVNASESEDKQEFIDYTLKCAEYDTGIIPTTDDSFITLSTCTGSGHSQRMIVHGILTDTASRG